MAVVLFRLPAKPSVPFPTFFGSRISGQAADVIPEFDLPLHLPLDCQRFCRRESEIVSLSSYFFDSIFLRGQRVVLGMPPGSKP
jgi:hypothetical protein